VITTWLILGSISLILFAIGLVMVVVPSLWQRWVRHSVDDPFKRLMMGQGLLLAGLLLVVGSADLRGRWLWTALGGLILIKALVLLGLHDAGRRSVLALWERLPPVSHRLLGVVWVALATLLAIDVLRGPQ